MRHGKKINHLSRTHSHRAAMLSNMATSLIMHKRINTTVAKAKALRKYVEPIITRSKDDSTHSRRMVFSYLLSKDAVTELFREVAPKIAERPGGYTRILKTGNRLGDNAEMCMMELVDFNENMLSTKEAKKTKTTRRRGSSKKKQEAGAAGNDENTASETTVEAKAEAPKKSRRKKADSDDKEEK
jgi:large subunit ribosomal protein L17